MDLIIPLSHFDLIAQAGGFKIEPTALQRLIICLNTKTALHP